MVMVIAVGLALHGPAPLAAQPCSSEAISQGECAEESPLGNDLLRLEPQPPACSTNNAATCATADSPPSFSSSFRLFFPLVAKPGYHPVTLPIGVNSGGPAVIVPSGQRFIEDLPYSTDTGIGYIGGEAVASVAPWDDINNTDDDVIYRTARSGVEEYRFDLANGTYMVELSLAEIRQHWPGLRIFSVHAEDRPVIVDLDLHALAQHDYAVRYRFAVEVRDRQLNLRLSPLTGQTLVNAIWITRRAPDDQPPVVPSQVKIVGGYSEALLRWHAGPEDDIGGYHVYRSPTAGGPFQRITPAPTPLTRYFDRDQAISAARCYRISAVDVFGNEGPQSPAQCTAIVDYDATSLPVFRLAVHPDDMVALNIDPSANVEVPATLRYNGEMTNVRAEYRGRSTQFSNKKSWKLIAAEPFTYSGQATLLLNGEGYDPASIHDKLSYDLLADIGIQPLQSSFVDLDLNGRFMGVFTQLENPDSKFLRRTGRDPFGDVFKCADGLDTEPDCENEIVGDRNMEDLYDLAAVINRTPDAEFAAAIADVLDVQEYIDYQAGKALTADLDSTHQYLLVAPSAAAKWQILPWDNDVSFRTPTLPLDYGTVGNPAYFDQVNMLWTRMLAVPQYRRYYGDRILELVDGMFSSSAMASRLADMETQVWFDLERDIWKVNREDNDATLQRLAEIQVYVNRRIAYLRDAVPAFVPARGTYLAINEVMPRNVGTLIDPADGRADPWFEIFNAGAEPVDLGGMYMSDNPALPKRFRFASGVVVPALGGLVIWADGQPQQGNNHVNFTLYGSGGQLRLTAADGVTPVDTLSFPPLPADVSLARFPDQSGPARPFSRPTPGEPNRLRAPEITDVGHRPDYPQAGEPVTVRARLTDDGHVVRAELTYTVGVTPTIVPMFDDGHHDDGARNDGLYAGQIPALPDGPVVRYYVTGGDDDGRVAYHPFAAPALTHDYRVGFLPPPVAISEFMADNETTIEDPDEPGEFPDWIEIANLTQQSVNLGGYYLTDKLTTPTKYRIPNGTTVAAGQSVIFWADDDGTQGPFHTNFKLSAGGESVGLFDPDGVTPVTAFEFGPQLTDVSYGACPLPDGRWDFNYLPTPGAANVCGRIYLPSAVAE